MPRRLLPFVVIVAVSALALASFTWPAGRLAPRDVPVGIVGPAPAPLPDGYDVHRYVSTADARAAIADRTIYGAVSARTLFIATAASPAVAATLREAAPGLDVVDVVPAPAGDPRTVTLSSLTLPLMLVGIVSAILAMLTATTVRRRLAILATGAMGAGVFGALYTHTWLDALPGSWPAIGAAVALVVLAVSATVTGLASHLGRPGIGLGAVLMMLVGNPWSGITSAPELLPAPAGAIGQLLPAGAGGNLLRSVAFFDGRGGTEHVVVLGAWVAVGLTLVATAAARRRVPALHAAPAMTQAATSFLSLRRGAARSIRASSSSARAR